MRIYKIAVIFVIVFSFLFWYSNYISEQEKKPFVATLMIHSVKDEGPKSPLEDGVIIRPDHLSSDLAYLKKQQYKYIDSKELITILNNPTDPKVYNKNIFVTFDDGYRNNYTKAYPILKQLGIKALISIIVYYIEHPHVTVDGRNIDGTYLTWDQINEMIKSGLVEIGSHSYNSHNDIPHVSADKVSNVLRTRDFVPELVGRKIMKDGTIETYKHFVSRITNDLRDSVNYIKMRTGVTPDVIAFPFGWASKEAERISEKLGLVVQMNVKPGINYQPSDLGQIKRITVKDSYIPRQLDDRIKYYIGIRNILP